MRFFRYPEDRLPVLLIVLLFALDLLIFFFVQNVGFVSAWMVLSIIGKIFVAPWNHHHQHVNTFRQTWANRLLEIVYTFHTGITTNVWVLHHNLGHHVNYLDQEKDESGWTRKDGSRMGVFEYTVITAVTGYFRAAKVGKRYPKFQRGFVGMGIFNLLLLALMVWYNPINAILIFLVPMMVVYLGTCWTTYYHHSGLETDDHLHASHNVTNKYYNIITGNLGLHTAHHMKQGLHWSKLGELHKSIEDQIPSELINPNFPGIGGFLIRTWRRVGGEADKHPS